MAWTWRPYKRISELEEENRVLVAYGDTQRDLARIYKDRLDAVHPAVSVEVLDIPERL